MRWLLRQRLRRRGMGWPIRPSTVINYFVLACLVFMFPTALLDARPSEWLMYVTMLILGGMVLLSQIVIRLLDITDTL